MSFQLPSKVPSFSSSQRSLEDSYWRASKTNHNASPTNNGLNIGTKISNFISPDQDLPMYKDKPFFAPRRTRKRRKFAWMVLCMITVLVLWWFIGRGDDEGAAKGGTKALSKDKLWQWVQSFDLSGAERGNKNVDWAERRERVKDAFIVSWDGYAEHAWGRDTYEPIAKKGQDTAEGGMGWIIVDALDTLMIMNLTSRVQHARDWIHTSLNYDKDTEVNTFEATIRMLGGLLSAHHLSTTYPDLAPVLDDDEGAAGEDLYIEKATDLAERLLGAFDSESGIPYSAVNLTASAGIPMYTNGGLTSTSEATSVQLEFKYLAKLTGETNYWETVEHIMKVVESNGMQDGLLPIFMSVDTGRFPRDNIRLGSRGDSYYEYLIKQYLQTSKEEPIYQDLWDEALTGIQKHLITYSKNADLTVLGERPDGLQKELLGKMDHLVCFMPGTIALGATGGLPISQARKLPEWGRKQEQEILLAKELMKTCWASYLATASGLAGEISYFELNTPRRTIKDMYPDWSLSEPGSKFKSQTSDLFMKSRPLYPIENKNSAWRKDITVKQADAHNLQRPETVESLLYMYRILEDDTYRHWGWEMFKKFISHTAVMEDFVDPSSGKTTSRIRAFTSLSNVDVSPAEQQDHMESFWLSETLKYFYLLFSDRNFLSLEETVYNTEGHIFPRFKMGELFKTGWTRQFPRT